MVLTPSRSLVHIAIVVDMGIVLWKGCRVYQLFRRRLEIGRGRRFGQEVSSVFLAQGVLDDDGSVADVVDEMVSADVNMFSYLCL